MSAAIPDVRQRAGAARLQSWHMQTADAEWDAPTGRQVRTIVGPDAAVELCAEIEAQGADHLLVSFTTPTGVFLAIGLGAPDSCVVYWESADPPYFQSRGAATDPSAVTYYFGGQASELPCSVRIDRESAFWALAEYMRTGRRPQTISWDVT